MTISELIMTLKNSYAELPELSCEELSELSHEELAKVTDWIISAVKLDCAEASRVFERAAYNLNAEYYDNSPVELYTFPDDDSKFTKAFKVERDWLIDRVIDLDKLNACEGVSLQSFLDNYIWEESDVIYKQAKSHGKVLSEVELVITKELIHHALEWGYIKLIKSPNGLIETVCSIGDNWFYFGSDGTIDMSPYQLLSSVPFDDIVDSIFTTIDSFRTRDDFRDEYAYYEAYLRETKLMEDFVLDALSNADTAFRRLQGSLWFEVFSPTEEPFSVVKITDALLPLDMIELDGKFVSKEEFILWAKTMSKNTKRGGKGMIKIYWDDLTKKKQEEILEKLGENGNWDVFPIAEICEDGVSEEGCLS